ncbi:glycosyltransferase family 9 protein [Veillonella rodentium]|uniref:Lipopolysaccharide core heptosyltransferase rfaQ n=1 Tax=Veillonella rodentium TaxID=248315 RepID=A0A239YU68_9FIRM|nr:glycosyltransferase family 9 protein [Veillonella rodentium]SNV62721.1 Lipopolysaccharide core heptosyltransferase rfaQ [Veillonella rodentium]
MELDNKRIVVTFLMHLGDVILTTPFLEVLRKAAPHSHITYVIDEKLQQVMQYNPNIDELVVVDKKGRHNSISGLNAVAREINAKGKPDIVINLHPNERTSYLAWKIHAPVTTGMSHFLFRPFMTKYTRLDRKTRHAADMYINVLEQLGVTDLSNSGLHIEICEAWRRKAHDFYTDHGVKDEDKLIGFNIGSAVPEKRWPAERFAHVADYFGRQGYKTIFFGGPMDIDMVEPVVKMMETKPIVATGAFQLGPLAAAMGWCSLLITNDSGPMHVAVSQHVPVVALYGPSNPFFYGPYQAESIVLESMDTYEIGKSMKQIIKEGHYAGISVISEDEVIKAAETLLSETK